MNKKKRKLILTAICWHLDKDECTSNNGGCEHVCLNSYLSHACHCRGGYTIAADNKNCNGKTASHESEKSEGVFCSYCRFNKSVHSLTVAPTRTEWLSGLFCRNKAVSPNSRYALLSRLSYHVNIVNS